MLFSLILNRCPPNFKIKLIKIINSIMKVELNNPLNRKAIQKYKK